MDRAASHADLLSNSNTNVHPDGLAHCYTHPYAIANAHGDREPHSDAHPIAHSYANPHAISHKHGNGQPHSNAVRLVDAYAYAHPYSIANAYGDADACTNTHRYLIARPGQRF